MSISPRFRLDEAGNVTLVEGDRQESQTVAGLVEYFRRHHREMDARVIRCLGCLCLFLSLREAGRYAASDSGNAVLTRAKKLLDSFYLHADDSKANTYVDQGLGALEEHLFTTRQLQYGEVMRSALEFCSRYVAEDGIR